jgi:hypothetical protein
VSNKNEMYKLAAQKMLQLDKTNKEHEKRAHALRLLYKQAELGYGEIPRSYSDLQEKIASLIGQDLHVMEKALELTGGTVKLGELAQAVEPSQYNATESFMAAILNLEN